MRTCLFILLWVFWLCGPALAGEFRGHACTKDCSGHRAGYAWAARKGLTDPAQCRGRSKSFVEGCRIYAAERVAAVKKTK